MERLLISSTYPQPVSHVAGHDVVITGFHFMASQPAADFTLLAIVTAPGATPQTQQFRPVVTTTGVFFSGPVIRVPQGHTLSLQLQAAVSLLGELTYRVL